MATYEEIEHGSTTLGEILTDITINSLTTLSRGLIMELVSPYVNDFNKMNHDFMNIHMMRNAFEKTITLDNVGESAYYNGDGNATATPAQAPSYVNGNNYMEFVTNVREANKSGMTTPRVNTEDGVVNKYFDSNDPDTQIEYSSSVDKNSILFKTQRLLRLNKLKTIISAFHTKDVNYVGQVGSKEFGESHGRNLLTKDAENGGGGYEINGYDNPYCRVWTNHYKYDKLSKTMRANSQLMNYWPGFEWDESDKGHGVDSSKYSDGENYDYAWRGKHNQNRRWVNSVLDPKTGLVKMAPQYRGGGEINRHTKECMFSIENLAWRDYDPYSFEEALSWEQRGPFGGRIMWFPPYGIEIQETTNAKWQSNEFIGRGEPVYTYVNSERTGNLSFIMLTDHPSSIDYASWWDDNHMIKNTTDISGNSENDYLRYFSGCIDGTGNGNSGEDLVEDGIGGGKKNEDFDDVGLKLKPTPLTDEYTKPEPPPLIQAVRKPGPQVPEDIVEDQPPEDKTPIYVEFFVFYPNNYSGVMDYPSNSKIDKDKTYVDSIAYLLAGRNANKVSDGSDFGLYLDGGFAHDDRFIGYEMDRGPITTNDCIKKGQFIQGGVRKAKTYTVERNKKWQYRVDHIQPYTGDDDTYHNGTNLLNENISTVNLKDTSIFNLNLKVDGDVKAKLALHKDNVYSLAEVAAAIYSEEMVNYPDLYKYLKECGVSEDRVKTLVDIFNNPNLVLKDIECKGFATTQGPQEANEFLYQNRAKTVLSWLRTVEKWKDIAVNTDDNLEPIDNLKQIKQVDKNDANDANGKSSKLYRSARCVMTFTSGITDQVDNTPDTPTETDDDESNSVAIDKRDIVGFRLIAEKPMPNGKIWRYYEKDGSVKYYDQVVGSSDNYDEPAKDDVVIKEEQIFQIFKTDGYQPEANEIIRKNSKYRGFYNEFGIYDITFDYSKSDEPDYEEFDEDGTYNKDDKVIYNNHYYVANEDWHGEWSSDAFRNISASYAVGDFVLYQEHVGDVEKFYECQVNFIEKYADYGFNTLYWDNINTLDADEISDSIKDPYAVYEDEPADGYDTYSVVFLDDKWQVCTKVNTLSDVTLDTNVWDYLVGHEGYIDFGEAIGQEWNSDTYVVYEGERYHYIGPDGDPYNPDDFDDRDWQMIDTDLYSLSRDYEAGDIMKFGGQIYFGERSENHLYTKYKWSDDMSIFLNITQTEGPDGEFDGNYPYIVGDICKHDDKYWRANTDSSEWDIQSIEFDPEDWTLADDKYVHSYNYGWELAGLVEKAAAVLCWTTDKMYQKVNALQDTVNIEPTGEGVEYEVESNPENSCVFKYGLTNGLVTTETVTTGKNLCVYAEQCESTCLDSGDESAPIRFTEEEQEYLQLLDDTYISEIDIQLLRTYIVMCRILDGIKKVEDETGTRNVCVEAATNDEEMTEKTERKDESKTEGCDNIWVDRGDGILIQECNIGYEGGRIKSRFDPETGKGDWNKLRYDQEYHFYKQWIADHPLMYEKLQEKIKYFNPAFHSMTPEGFNARCTFLQQCTRQGNTKTMSDKAGRTASNLAFGRPPYCVLRLGDFYYQMIVIDNISFDYNVDNGIQWDLNTEGNGVQPMLCKVNISFKFIGGGDITGPVQRLQNAMSFNYYANASFYDNRADRVQYQATNWATMGGAGNNEVDIEKSYAYVAKRYQETGPNMVTPVQ